MMHLFGDPAQPRRNLWGGFITALLGALALGMNIEAILGDGGPGDRGALVRNLVLTAALLLAGAAQFARGLRHVPRASPDAASARELPSHDPAV